MEPGTKNSFIPQDAQSAPVARDRPGGLADLFVLLSIVFFVISLVLGAGVFLYQQFLQTSSKSKVAQLERAKTAFDPSLIQELTRLDDRMQSADIVLSNHVAFSAFFQMLEHVTLATVSFRSLEFDASDSQHMTIKMDGIAQSVNSIALQADLFSRDGVITSPIFSNIDRQADGVHFTLSALINPASIRYARLAGGQPTQTAPASQSASPAGTSTNVPGQQVMPLSPFGQQQVGQGSAPQTPAQ